MLTTYVPWNSNIRPSVDELEAALQMEGYRTRIIKDDAGAQYDWHTHEFPQLLVMAEGSMTVATRALQVEMNPGDRLYLAANEEHSARMGEGVVRYFDMEQLP